MAAAAPGLAALSADDRRKVLHDNAAALYNIE
jgi:predicted TIM-barrel fold metal-dependent hydrolase